MSEPKLSIPLFQNAARVLGFNEEEKLNMYKICTAILHMSNIKLKQRPREEQAEVADPAGKNQPINFSDSKIYHAFV